jgi:hypothetical protein
LCRKAQFIECIHFRAISIDVARFYLPGTEVSQPIAYAFAKEVMGLNAMAKDAQGEIGAFLEKRAPC